MVDQLVAGLLLPREILPKREPLAKSTWQAVYHAGLLFMLELV
jgi:hypothetical protein